LIGSARLNIRTRLTAWYVVVLAAVLLAYAVSASYLLRRDLRAQLVRFAIQDLETVEGLLFFTPDGTLQFRDDYHNHPESKLIQERMLEVRSTSGEVLYRNEYLGNRALDGDPAREEGLASYSAREVELTDGTHVQLVSRRHSMAGRSILLRVAYSLEPLQAQFRSELLSLLLPLPFILGAAGVIGYYLTRRSLQPIREMSQRANEITSEQLDARLPVDRADGELADLAQIFNEMLSRLEQSFAQLRRFTSDASHELRTPLTLIRSVGEVGLQTNSTPDQYRDTIGSMLEEANRLTQLVENLLTISRADAGQIGLQRSEFQAIDLARESGSLLDVLLEEKSQTLRVSGDERLVILGDWLLLRQALVNILHNAIKYSPIGGVIEIYVRATTGQAEIEVRDNGPGIAAEHRSKVFDRFYRIDGGRSVSQGGTGLGLSIAQWTVRAHGGEISVKTNGSIGASFLIHLPSSANLSI
jgi:heavy metal sensor kinase